MKTNRISLKKCLYSISECPVLEFIVFLETLGNWETLSEVHLSIGPNMCNRAMTPKCLQHLQCMVKL